MRRDRFWRIVAGGAAAGVALGLACVGDSPPNAPPDSGIDAAITPDVAADSPQDSGVRRCDPLKPFGAPVALSSLNSASDERNVTLSADELTLYLVRKDGSGQGDIWVATRANVNDVFLAPALLGGVNGPSDEGNASITGDGKNLVFHSNRDGGAGLYDLYVATRANPQAQFTQVVPMIGLNAPSNEYHPFVLPTGKTLYFDSNNRDGGVGAADIYVASGIDPVSFGSAALVPELSSTASDTQPTVSADALTIVFGSDRPGGQGGLDLWIATRPTIANTFGPPENMGPTLNASGTDLPGWLSADGCLLYFSSDRAGGFGLNDIWLARRGQ